MQFLQLLFRQRQFFVAVDAHVTFQNATRNILRLSLIHIFRPLLDAMQTTPAFVYLVPIVMLFGIGNVPGVVVTIIFALPPIIRLTLLGINQVPADLMEASRSFGASPSQMLFKVQLPLSMPTIMAVSYTHLLLLSFTLLRLVYVAFLV